MSADRLMNDIFNPGPYKIDDSCITGPTVGNMGSCAIGGTHTLEDICVALNAAYSAGGSKAAIPAAAQDSPDVADMLAEFHAVMVPDGFDVRELRRNLLAEESQEADEALESGDRATIARELADVVYVAYGSALVYDIDLDAAIAEIHRANMSKLGDDGNPILRNDGKVLKGPNFSPPDMTAAINGGYQINPEEGNQ